MRLTDLTFEDCQNVREWRNQDIAAYRTPFFLTDSMQEDFYHNVVSDRTGPHRYMAVDYHNSLVGMVGLVNIQWGNRNAEISIVIDPKKRRTGAGRKCLELLLDWGFNVMGLENIYGECYSCSPFKLFWFDIIKEYGLYNTILPGRKFYHGLYHDSIYFNFNKGDIK